MGTLRARLAKGSAWIVGARALSNLIGFISNVLLARILAPEDFGLVTLGASMLSILSSVTELSLSSALVQHKNPTSVHYDTAWTLNVARGVVLAAVFSAAAYPVAGLYSEPRLATVMIALAGGALLTGLANPRTIMLQRDLIFWQQFLLLVTQKLLGLIVAIAVAIAYRTYWAIIAGTLAGQLASTLLSYVFLPYRPRIGIEHSRELFSFSMWLSFGQVLSTLNWKLDHLLIGGLLGRSSLGLYSVGDQLAVIPSREAIAPLTSTMFPAFSLLAGDRGRVSATYQKAQALITSIALPAGFGMALIADPLIRLTMGERWLPAVAVIQVLASVYALTTLGALSKPLAMAMGETRLQFKKDLQYFAARVPLLLIGFGLGGFAGILYARAIADFSGSYLNMRVVTNVIGLPVREQILVNARSMMSVCVMSAVVCVIGKMTSEVTSPAELVGKICAMAVAGAATYFGVLIACWIVSGRPAGPETEIIGLLKVFRRS